MEKKGKKSRSNEEGKVGTEKGTERKKVRNRAAIEGCGTRSDDTE